MRDFQHPFGIHVKFIIVRFRGFVHIDSVFFIMYMVFSDFVHIFCLFLGNFAYSMVRISIKPVTSTSGVGQDRMNFC